MSREERDVFHILHKMLRKTNLSRNGGKVLGEPTEVMDGIYILSHSIISIKMLPGGLSIRLSRIFL